MQHPPASSSTAPRMQRARAGARVGAWWLVRLLLVLAVMFDQASGPFHRHHHDSADGLHELAERHAQLPDGTAQLDAIDTGVAAHSTLALRSEATLQLQPPLDDGTLYVALVAFVQAAAALEAPASAVWKPDRGEPDFRSHRSLPPAGRAPPLHA